MTFWTNRYSWSGLSVQLLFAVAFVGLPAGVNAAEEPADGKKAWAVATFECLGLYYDSPELGECQAQYRKESEEAWHKALSLVYCPRQHQYRGSVVGLTPDRKYHIRLECDGQKVEFSATTWSETFPVGKTTYLPGGLSDQPVRITESGTAEAWHLVTPTPGTKTVIDVFNFHDNCVEIAADYVIVRGLELRNATTSAVLIRKGVQHVVVEDCHMTRWGRLGGARSWGITNGSDSGVLADKGAGYLIIQRNLIENPRSGSNDWESGHPDGPQGISLFNTSGGNVIRYNTIRSTEDHGFNDGFGGGDNFSFAGSPNRDSDIYGNIICNCWDDAIESEGANMNVRIFSNYLDKTNQLVATAAVSMGPIYIFRNVFGQSRVSHQDQSGGFILKTAGGTRMITVNGQPVPGDLGRRYIFHNTALQPNGALNVFMPMVNGVSRNNIFRTRGKYMDTWPGSKVPPEAPPNDFRNDLTGDYHYVGSVQALFVPSERPGVVSLAGCRNGQGRQGRVFAQRKDFYS